jgi:hypothetical protein
MLEERMDPTRFDTLSRTLGRLRSRRGLGRVVGGSALAAALGLLGAADPAAAGCAKKCGPCKRCKHGKCKPKPNDTPCKSDGRCLKGRCNPLPTCTPARQGCETANPGACCSGVCGGGQSPTCVPGEAGDMCLANSDCISEQCIGYRCQGEVDCATKQNGTLCETNRACHDGACVACWTEANDGCGVVRSGTVIITRPAICFGDQCHLCTSDLWCEDRCLDSACRNHCFKSCTSSSDCCPQLTCQPMPEQGNPDQKRCAPA